ncbi:hypothetical protein LEP1GSC120_2097 [Leptospira santarosai str. 200702252]|nr:hypothetical protein LEP1GSC130_1192 [Leptospira santarosai str. 200403458]EMO98633.1 hypothetical protein LEP1GSC120_2097 [Leptospira santarosai str. 200702252]
MDVHKETIKLARLLRSGKSIHIPSKENEQEFEIFPFVNVSYFIEMCF